MSEPFTTTGISLMLAQGMEECKLSLPDYFANDDFILTFTQVLSYTSWLGIPWNVRRMERIWSNVLLLALTVSAIFTIKRMMAESVLYKVFIESIGVINSVYSILAIILLRRLRSQWPLIAKAWSTGNHTLPVVGTTCTTLRRNMFRIFVFFTALSLLQRLYVIIMSALEINIFSSGDQNQMASLLDQYITWSRRVMVSSSWYAPYVAGILEVLKAIIMAIFIIGDFVVIAFGMGLAARQRRLNEVLKDFCGRESDYQEQFSMRNLKKGQRTVRNDVRDWRKLREAFVRHSRLITIVNDTIGPLIFVTIFSNLAYILIILAFCLPTLQKEEVMSLSYYVYTLTWYFLRSFILLLKTSDVHNLSTYGAEYLRLCNMESHNVEVRRFYFQLCKLEVSLHGMGFFKLRRVFMLKALSITITYYLMLQQYNDRLS